MKRAHAHDGGSLGSKFGEFRFFRRFAVRHSDAPKEFSSSCHSFHQRPHDRQMKLSFAAERFLSLFPLNEFQTKK